MKTGKAARRRVRDRRALLAVACGAGAILLLAAGVASLMTPPVTAAGVTIGGPFSLVADDGHKVTERSFPGKYLAVYFGYTHCQDVCPATMTNLAAALARLGGKGAQVQPLFVTVDPLRDSPEVLHRFVANFSPSLRGLTGSAEQLSAINREYHVVSIENGGGAAGYTVDHSSVIYLMDPKGAFVAPVPADASEMVMAQAIARYAS